MQINQINNLLYAMGDWASGWRGVFESIEDWCDLMIGASLIPHSDYEAFWDCLTRDSCHSHNLYEASHPFNISPFGVSIEDVALSLKIAINNGPIVIKNEE